MFPREGLRSPGKLSGPPRSKELARNRVRKREKERIEKNKDMGTQALIEQMCFNQHGVGIYDSIYTVYIQGGYPQQR